MQRSLTLRSILSWVTGASRTPAVPNVLVENQKTAQEKTPLELLRAARLHKLLQHKRPRRIPTPTPPNPKTLSNFTYPRAISIRERLIKRFDEANLKPEFLPLWYKNFKVQQAEAPALAAVRRESRVARLKLVTQKDKAARKAAVLAATTAAAASGVPAPAAIPNTKRTPLVLRHLLKSGPTSSPKLYMAVQSHFASHSAFRSFMQQLVLREIVAVKEVVSKKGSEFLFRLRRQAQVVKKQAVATQARVL